MKKLQALFKPIPIAILSLLIVSLFLRYYLYISSNQLIKEFKTQNNREIYSLDTLKISSRLNSLSSAINWVCLEGSIANKSFYLMERGLCENGIFQQKQEVIVPEANNLKISFTVKLPREIEYLIALFLFLQLLLISAIVLSTKNSEEEKRYNEIRITKLARQMSHDIRSPLATLNTVFSRLYKVDSEDINLINRSIERINQISNNLLTNSKKEIINNFIPKLDIYNLNDILSDIVSEKSIEYENSLFFIGFKTAQQKILVHLDEGEFKRCLSNLINNSAEAKKTTSNNIELNISIIVNENECCITLADNGIGIDQKVLDQIGKEEVTTKKNGNGLGLVHTFECIKNWNGSINIKSTKNLGTEIRITLPIIAPKEHFSVLVDDDELVRMTWSATAKRKGVNFLALAGPDELRNILSKLDLNSIIYLDSNLSEEIAGEDLAKEIFKQGFNNIFITSGYDKEKFSSHMSYLKGIRDKSPPWK